MIISLKKWRERIRFIIVFATLAYVLFHIFQYIYNWIEPWDKGGEPSGHAVKVFEQLNQGSGEMTFMDRVMFFFWYGE